MFRWFFNRRAQNKLSRQASHSQHQALLDASTMLRTQLLGTDRRNLEKNPAFNNSFSRGYVFGFLGAALHNAGLESESMSVNLNLSKLGHAYLFSGNALLAEKFATKSFALLLSKDEAFSQGAELGFDEFMSSVYKGVMAQGLYNNLHN